MLLCPRLEPPSSLKPRAGDDGGGLGDVLAWEVLELLAETSGTRSAAAGPRGVAGFAAAALDGIGDPVLPAAPQH